MEADESQALCGALQLIDLGSVLDAVVEQAHKGLRDATVDARSSATDQERRKALLLHLHQTRQRLLRLLVLVQWSNKAKATVEVSNVLEKAASHANTLRDAADQLYHQHNDPFLIRAPAHDVPTALDVLQTGGYNLLPSVIETLKSEPEASPRKRAAAVQLMDQLLRNRLLQEQLPRGLRVARVANGAAELRSGDEYEVKLILVPAPEQTSIAAQSAGEEQSEEAAAMQTGEPSSSGRQPPEDAMDTETGPEKSKAPSPGEEWRWRIMSLTILQGPKTDAWMTPAQTMHLQRQTDELMWRSADAISLRGRQSDPASSTAEASAPPPVKLEQSGMLGAKSEAAPQSSSLHAASFGPGSSGLGSELDSGRPTEAQSGTADLAQVVPPLEMMHRVLRMTAQRLVVLEAMAWAQQQVQSPEQRWHKLLRREKGRLLTGGRITYWLEVKAVSAAELHQLAGPTNGDAQKGVGATAAGVTATAAGVTATAAPALELGMDPQSQLKLLHEPALFEVDDNGAPQAPVDLQIDLHTADLEGALLQAAAATANVQLAALLGLLRSRGEISGNNGEVLLDCRQPGSAESAAALHPGNLRGHSSGVLELRSLGTSLLCVSVQLTSGQLLLRAGRSLQDSAEIAVHIRGEEDKLFALQKQSPPNGVQLSAGHFALLQVARSLEKLFLQLCLRQRFLSHSFCVGAFGLAQVPMPARALKEYLKNNPLAPRFSSKHITVSSFPPPSPILSMLPTDALSERGTSPAGSRKSTPGLNLSPLADLSPGTGGGTPYQATSFQNTSTPGGRGPAGSAQVDAGSSGRWDAQTSGAATAVAILGEGGRSLQFLLASELKAGMRWEYALLSMSCDPRGQPLKVLNLVKVPEPTLLPRQTLGKRKRADDAAEAAPPPRRQPAGQQGTQTDDADGCAKQQSEAQLSGVVAWCRERIAWEQLSLHLQVMGVPFQRASVPAASAKRMRTAGSLALGPSTPAEIAWHQRTAPRKSLAEAEAAAASQQQTGPDHQGPPEQRLWVNGLAALENLDGCVDAAPAGPPQLEFSVGRTSSPDSGDAAWTLGVASSYLAGLQQAEYKPSDGGERLPSGGSVESTQEGLLFSYPSAAGATAWSALQDLDCITRLHSCVQRVRQLCNARLEGAEPPSPRLLERPSSQPSDLASQAPTWKVPRSGRVTLTATAVQSAQLRVHAAANWEAEMPEASQQAGEEWAEAAQATDPGSLQSVEVQNPQTPPSTIFGQDYEPAEDFPLQETRRNEQQPALPEGRQLSDIFGETGFTNDGFTADGFALDSFDLQPFRMHTSVAATAATAATAAPPVLDSARSARPPPETPAAEVPAPEKLEAAAAAASAPSRVSAVAETLAISLTLRWRPCIGGGAFDARRIACRLEAEPHVPAPVLSALQEMLDAGEEEVFLDALCICAAPLAVLAAVLQPSALADCGLQAASVVLLWPRPPYRAQLLVQTPDGFLLSCTLHFFAASLVGLSASLQRTSPPQAAAAAKGPGAKAAVKASPDLPSLQPLLAKLLQIPGVSPPEEDVGGAGSSEAQRKPAGRGGAPLGSAASKVHPRAAAARQSAGVVWCRSWALEQALSTAFRFAAGERV